MSYKCEIIADSLSPQNHRLTTFKVTYPRIIHSEFCRHRILSRNTASSRAIPFEKMVKDVQENPFIPIAWQKSHKGMQGTEYWIDDDTVTVDEGDEYERYTEIYSATEHFITEWLEARDLAIAQSYELNRLGVTKQLCNRLLEPFVWTTELVSGTEWDNFFSLRCPSYLYDYEDKPIYFKSKKEWVKYYNESRGYKENNPDFTKVENLTDLEWLQINKSQAEIHIQKIAEMMWDEINLSIPKTLKEDQWHIPYSDNMNISADDSDALWQAFKNNRFRGEYECESIPTEILVATARAARISYTTLGDNPKIDYEADIKLHDRLLESKHLSCFEHCSRAMSEKEYESFYKGEGANKGHTGLDENKGWCNNYRGFINYRYLIENQ